ncbi:MAG TPA: hypothetical protein VFK85_04590 [Anaeromyxobacteraceae bacterium]|nr:hypothetical protein [Anaeromyxobacteraceae bacterium]
MQTRNRSTVVSESAVQATLRRAPARELQADEDRAMRMRLGASVPAGAPLERKPAGNEDAEIELLAAEIEMFMRMRDQLRAHAARRAATSAAAAEHRPVARVSAAKTKIVRALRKKR